MPLLLKDTIYGDCQFGVWEIAEDYDDMLETVEFFPGERKRFDGFKSEDRRFEWLSVRMLLRSMLGEQPQIVYNKKRKPSLLGDQYKISISHSRRLTSILLSKGKKVGLDLEYMSHDLTRVKDKFINGDEFITEDPELYRYHLYIHWCAKEALYKICDKQDINFRKNLTIEPFEPDICGVIYGWVDNKFWHDKFEMHYFRLKDYVVVFCCK
ncbi:MAG: 4'-phosphopantetheinyl transferase superfamily protein [Bacteroidales bacterium]|nr:4'-phosphopantetheinyl transferase superfamily protein [Bacteroidales bacterium]